MSQVNVTHIVKEKNPNNLEACGCVCVCVCVTKKGKIKCGVLPPPCLSIIATFAIMNKGF